MAGDLDVRWLGTVAYAEALSLQEKQVEARRSGREADVLLLLEHPPVVTLGRGADDTHLRVPREALIARGIDVHTISRGGDVTYHGPGQLVGYPILALDARGARDVHRYLRDLESALIDALAVLGVEAEPRSGWTGVFVAGSDPPRKIASIGVGVRGWITFHGFALNVTVDLGGFDTIVPCGLHGVEMTSVERELGGAPDLFERSRGAVVQAFRARFA